MNKLPIVYSGYWDAPLAFVVAYNEKIYLFWRGHFNDELDDYPSIYKVSQIKDVSFAQVKENWTALADKEQVDVGEIDFRDVIFDPTKRKEIDALTIRELIQRKTCLVIE